MNKDKIEKCIVSLDKEDFILFLGYSSSQLRFFFDLYKKRDLKKLRKFIDELKEIEEDDDCLFVPFEILYFSCLNNNDLQIKNWILKIVQWYKEERCLIVSEMLILLLNNLKKFYFNKEDLEKIYTLILKEAKSIDPSNINELIVDIILQAKEWIEKNIELSVKEKLLINLIIYRVLNSISFDYISDALKEKFFRHYVTSLWEVRSKIDIKLAFAPLFKGIGWNYIYLQYKAKKNKDILMNYFISLGIEKRIAQELVSLIIKREEK
jgi:hypothetical protein